MKKGIITVVWMAILMTALMLFVYTSFAVNGYLKFRTNGFNTFSSYWFEIFSFALLGALTWWQLIIFDQFIARSKQSHFAVHPELFIGSIALAISNLAYLSSLYFFLDRLLSIYYPWTLYSYTQILLSPSYVDSMLLGLFSSTIGAFVLRNINLNLVKHNEFSR